MGACRRTDVDDHLLLTAVAGISKGDDVATFGLSREYGAGLLRPCHVSPHLDGAPLGYVDFCPWELPLRNLGNLGQFLILGLGDGYLHLVLHLAETIVDGQFHVVLARRVGGEGIVIVVADDPAFEGPDVGRGLVQVLDVGHQLYALARLDAEAARRHDPCDDGQRARNGVVVARHKRQEGEEKEEVLFHLNAKLLGVMPTRN